MKAIRTIMSEKSLLEDLKEIRWKNIGCETPVGVFNKDTDDFIREVIPHLFKLLWVNHD